ncbi:MAG: dienelactone hydrolase family protein [Bacteroidetes bacterium]|nr:dienelactone hydrolase family protein [Bacteroidota bacterium]
MKKILIAAVFFVPGIFSFCQELVTFEASDGLTVSADLYEGDKDNPYILFFHQARSSRGEYRESAWKFKNLGYNGLAVDLRSGEDCNYISNETASEAKRKGLPATYLDAEKDILAAIEYAWSKTNKPVVLFGSSYSASLCLKLAKGNDKIKAVVAFSPGEYFQPDLTMKDELNGLDKPVMVASSQREFTYVEEMLGFVDDKYKKLFSPKGGPGDHGAKALWSSCPVNREYWLELNLFFKKLK